MVVIKNRESNIECLRILSMFLIVCMHLLWHGNVLNECGYGTFDYYLFWSIRALCYISVNSYVLISGYFMVYGKFTIEKLFRIIIQTLFYSYLLFGVSIYLNRDVLSIENVMKTIFPISSGLYWYITTYVLLCIISPILNVAVEHINKQTHLITVMSFVFVFCIIPTFLFWTRGILSMGRDLNWFITLYLISSYIRKYNVRYSTRKLICLAFISVIFMIMSLVLIGALSRVVFGVEKEQDLMFCFNSVFSCVASVSIFLGFLNINITNAKRSGAINSISKLVLGVYLFHENPFFRPILWDLVKPSKYLHKNNGTIISLMYILAICIFIMVIGCMIEKIRQCIDCFFGMPKLYIRLEKKVKEMFKKVITEKDRSFKHSV